MYTTVSVFYTTFMSGIGIVQNVKRSSAESGINISMMDIGLVTMISLNQGHAESSVTCMFYCSRRA